MKNSHATSVAVSFVAIAIFAACGSSGAGTGFNDPAPGGGNGSSGASSGSSSGFTGSGDASAAHCDPGSGDLAGCGCAATTRACWTVPADKRNGNGCHDGTQACTKQGEFAVWGACTGEATACSTGTVGADGGGTRPPPPPPPLPPNCVCVPSAVRWCDTPAACNWGKQTCMPDGTWGACNETNDRPPSCASGDPSYNETCCLQANQCCQDFEGPDPDKSKGSCDAIACPGDVVK